MAVYPKGAKFMASVGTGAARIRKTFPTESLALAWEADQEALRVAVAASIVVPAPTPAAPPCWTLQEAYAETWRHVWKGTKGERKAVINAKQAVDYFGQDTPCSGIHPKWILDWMVELQDEHLNSGSTCNKKLSALNMMLKRAVDFGGLAALPRTQRYLESEHRIRWFSDQEEAAMLEASKKLGMLELREFIIVGIDTGFRRSELQRLMVRDCEGGLVVLHAGSTKSGKGRSVPASARVRAIVAERKAAGLVMMFPMPDPTLRRQWDTLRDYLGKTDDAGFIVHVLRHTCATRLAASGVPLYEVQAWMGHAAIATTLRYAHLMPGALMGAVQRMEDRAKAAAEMETT